MNKPTEAIFNLFDKCEEIEGAREEGYRMFPDYEAVTHYIFELERHCEKLEKTLDKACEEFTINNICPTNAITTDNCGIKCEKCWKEYLLKDE